MGKFGDSVLGFKEYFDEVLRYSNKTVECWAEDCKYGMTDELYHLREVGIVFEGSLGFDDDDTPLYFFCDGEDLSFVPATDSGWILNFDPDTGEPEKEHLDRLREAMELRKRVHFLLYDVDKEV